MIQIDESYPIPSELTELYRKVKRLEITPKLYYNDIRKILVAELDRYDRIYLVVDGFDELALRERTTFEGELLKLRPAKLSLAIPMSPIEGETRTSGYYECEKCERTHIELFFRCKICHGGEYDVCLDCKEKEGLWCLDDTHQLTEVSPRTQCLLSAIGVMVREHRAVFNIKLSNPSHQFLNLLSTVPVLTMTNWSAIWSKGGRCHYTR